jgi:hypothetical protein
MKNNLADIVLQDIAFFSLAPDSDIHPDAAVRQLEHIAGLLRELPDAERDSFFEHSAKRLEELRAAGASKEHLDLLENLRGNLGI